MPCVKCGDHTENLYMTNYISQFAIVCLPCYTEISKKGNK